MIITPRIRNNVCLTAHPDGCAAEVRRQIEYIKSLNLEKGPSNVLVIGSSTGYGLACRIAAAFGYGAGTVGVFFEKEGTETRPGTPGYYNMRSFDEEASKESLFSVSINGDAFSDELKQTTIDAIKQGPGKVDLVIYSLASGVRVDPADGVMYRSALKPLTETYRSRALDTMSGRITSMEIEPANADEASSTVKVMGGEDWKLWIDALLDADVLSEGAKTVAFSYIGPEMTQPIYRNGTIGLAKKDLEKTAGVIDSLLSEKLGGRAWTSVNKALVTRAAAVIPAISLYIAILFKVMKEKNLHEGCIEQAGRLFRDRLYSSDGSIAVDNEGRIRIDDLEMRAEIQNEVKRRWEIVSDDNIEDLSDISGYHSDFMQMHGFEVPGVDYTREVDNL